MFVGAENVQDTVSTVVPAGCSTVIVALVNATLMILSVHCGLGHSGAPGIGDTGASVAHSLSHHVRAVAVAVEIAILELDSCPCRTLGDEADLDALVLSRSLSICHIGLMSQLNTIRSGGSYANTRPH